MKGLAISVIWYKYKLIDSHLYIKQNRDRKNLLKYAEKTMLQSSFPHLMNSILWIRSIITKGFSKFNTLKNQCV